jgi:hypothetical protein
MRAFVVLATVALAACGGSSPPAQTPADTSSLESTPKEKAAETESAAPASSTASSAPSTAKPSTPAPADTAESAPAAPVHPAPSVTGAIDGKPFNPKVAQVLSPMKKDGRILIALSEASDCPAAGAKEEHASLTMLVPWSDGYKVDLSALKLTGKKGPGEITFSRTKKDVSATFKPSGTVTVVSAPMDKGKTGKLKIDLQSGDYMLAGDLDIELCVAPK